MTIALCALMSGSLLFEKKKESLLEVCAQLGFQTLKSNNILTPIMIAQEEALYLPPSKKLHAIEHFIKKINTVELQNSSLEDSDIAIQINKHLVKKSFVILVGDFLGDFNFTLLAKRHEVHLIMIRDSFEENPTSLGEGSFVDPQSGENAEFYFGKSARDAYAARYHDNDTKLFKHLNSLGISYQKIIT